VSDIYIKVKLGFYTHRKTAKLRALIGDDALWIPPRLWAYAAENQPDGDFTNYGSEELSMLLGCFKHASSMRQALLQAGFLDEPGVIHDWEEHNGYHKTYSDRAKNAALARWEKEKARKQEKERETDRDRDIDIETSIASSMHQASALDELRLKVNAMMGRRAATAWSESETKKLKAVLSLKTSPEDLASLEAYYASGSQYLRRDIPTLLNNWNGEIDRSKKPTINGHSNSRQGSGRASVIDERNAALGADAAAHAADARARSRAIDEADAKRFEETGLTPFDADPAEVSGESDGPR
jgi:hypothetical protein